jgi:uncharacterized damage-inducible protein DinB
MTAIDLVKLNFEEIRRRSLKLWLALPDSYYDWRPDPKAMSCLEMIRHILESEHLFHVIVNNRGNLGNYQSPWEGLQYTNVEAEVCFAEPYRKDFINAISTFSAEDLQTVEINRTEKGQKRELGDYLLRITYHEAVHTGQFLSYLRTIGLDRPLIWD